MAIAARDQTSHQHLVFVQTVLIEPKRVYVDRTTRGVVSTSADTTHAKSLLLVWITSDALTTEWTHANSDSKPPNN